MAQNINSVEDLQRELLKAVWKNESLRQEVMKDPVHSIQRILGIKIPDNLKVKVIDQTEEDVIYLILPHHPNNIYGFELTEEQIDKVAGGAGLDLSSLKLNKLNPGMQSDIPPYLQDLSNKLTQQDTQSIIIPTQLKIY